MKGQATQFGDRFQAFDDVCISYGGMSMSTGRTFDNEDGSASRPHFSHVSLNNCVQVMFIHEQLPNLHVADNVSETNPDWENQIDVQPLFDQTLQNKRDELLEEEQFLPTVCKVLNILGRLRDQFFYEFEIQTANLVVTMLEQQKYDVMLVNQLIPLFYRHSLQAELGEVFGETEYEMNEVCVLKKIAAFFITLATETDPINNEELVDVCS